MALIEDYALLSDCHSAALVQKNGSIDWLSFPRFDSPACFAALLGNEDNGRWIIAPKGESKAQRKYVDGTMVLQTTFTAPGGSCQLTDCLLIGDRAPTLVRYLEGLEGTVDIRMEIIIRFDYGCIIPWVRRAENEHYGIRAVAGPEGVLLTSPVPVVGHDFRTEAEFTISAGERMPFTLQWFPSSELPPHPTQHPYQAVRRTIYWRKEWSDRCGYNAFDSEGVKRSLLVLKALNYTPTGGIVAAPTTSLPEEIGGVRNWDYRYCWLRDATFTLYSLLNAGYPTEAERWSQWLLRAVAGTPDQVDIMYGLAGERRLDELELDWLSGYEKSKPVRIGNAAYLQNQMDVYGEVSDTIDLARRNGLHLGDDAWRIERAMIQHVAEHWQDKDEGIWEVRGPKRHFTQSKVMCWVAVDRAIKAVREFGHKGPVEEWEKLRDRIYRDVYENGFNQKMNSYVQSYGSEELDGSLLMLALVGFMQPGDPRLTGTVNAIQKYLTEDGFVLRYHANNPLLDGLPGKEGVFLACSFWLVDNLVLLNRMDEARALYERLASLRNDVGLFAEEYSPKLKRMLGNFPQAFSHVGHVNSASNISQPHCPAKDRSDAGAVHRERRSFRKLVW